MVIDETEEERCSADVENQRNRSLVRSLDGEMVSNALLKANCSSKMVHFRFLPMRMSSVNLSCTDCVLWYFLNPVWLGSKIFDLFKYAITWSWTSFSSTSERKLNSAIGRNSDSDDGTADFFSASMRAFFHDDGKIPWESDVLKSLVKCGAIAGRAFAMTICGMLSLPSKCDTASITSFSDTSERQKP